MNNCDNIPNTIYYSRKCPKGYKRGNLACEYDCAEMDDEEDFCIKKDGR